MKRVGGRWFNRDLVEHLHIWQKRARFAHLSGWKEDQERMAASLHQLKVLFPAIIVILKPQSRAIRHHLTVTLKSWRDNRSAQTSKVRTEMIKEDVNNRWQKMDSIFEELEQHSTTWLDSAAKLVPKKSDPKSLPKLQMAQAL